MNAECEEERVGALTSDQPRLQWPAVVALGAGPVRTRRWEGEGFGSWRSSPVRSWSRRFRARPGRCGRGRRYGPLSVSSFSFGLFSILFEMVSGMAWMEPATASDQQASS